MSGGRSTGQGPTKCLNFHLPFGLDFGSKEKKKGKGETKGKGVKLKGRLGHTKRKKRKRKESKRKSKNQMRREKPKWENRTVKKPTANQTVRQLE